MEKKYQEIFTSKSSSFESKSLFLSSRIFIKESGFVVFQKLLLSRESMSSYSKSVLTQRQADPPSALGGRRDFLVFGFG